MKYLPITKSQINFILKSCDEWGYGNSDTCKVVAEQVGEYLYSQGIDGSLYYQDLVSLAHNMNSGRSFYKIEIKEEV